MHPNALLELNAYWVKWLDVTRLIRTPTWVGLSLWVLACSRAGCWLTTMELQLFTSFNTTR
jgi:hypothetical protein